MPKVGYELRKMLMLYNLQAKRKMAVGSCSLGILALVTFFHSELRSKYAKDETNMK